MMRDRSFAEDNLTMLDRLGTALSRRSVMRHLGDTGGLTLADVGSGYHARLGASLASRCKTVHVFDVSLSPALETIPNVVMHIGDASESLKHLPDESIDTILCISVLEHVENDREMLRLFFRKLAPGGTLVVNVPSWFGKLALEFAAFKLKMSPATEMDDHKRYYDPPDLWPLLVSAGFPPHAIKCHRHKFRLNTLAVCRKKEKIR